MRNRKDEGDNFNYYSPSVSCLQRNYILIISGIIYGNICPFFGVGAYLYKNTFVMKNMQTPKVKIILFLMPQANLFDLGGLSQAFSEAKDMGLDIELKICAENTQFSSSIGVTLTKITHFNRLNKDPVQYLFLLSSNINYILSDKLNPSAKLSKWIKDFHQSGTTIVSVCNAAFLLGKIGLLDNIKCTTHWKRTKELQQMFPQAYVQEDILFIEDNNIITSAGSASAIDLALFVIAKIKDDLFSHKVARELVVFNRRTGHQPQESDYLKYRNHVHTGIHKAQDYIESNIQKKIYLFDLTNVANMSERNFCRVFKREVSLTVFEYIHKIRKEKITTLIESTDFSKRQIANKVGLKSERQLRRILSK